MKWDSQNCYNPYYNPLKELSMKSQNNTDLVQKDDFDSIVMGIMKNFEQNSLPDSISILINFGTEKSHVLYDADQVFHSVAFLCQLQEENSNVSSYTYNSICFYIFPFSIFICICIIARQTTIAVATRSGIRSPRCATISSAPPARSTSRSSSM